MTDQEPVKAGPEAPKKVSRPNVRLRTVGPKDRFDLSAHNLGVVGFEGKDFTSDQADEVRILALKHGVTLVAVTKED